ncbi:unnamed protein product [Aureobasidium pullulans]|nr:unnamed protein product [Aureobasidium pullulans]
MKVQLLLGALLPLVSAHFELIYPAARGFDEDNLGQFPAFPITGAPIQLLMGHTSAKEKGPQNFCIGAGALQFPAGLNITEGMNATIQVVTNGDPSGGLYNCADITFTSTQLSASDYSSHCSNSTGVTVSALTNAGNANSSTSDSTTSAAASGSTSAAASAASGTSTGAAAQATFAGFALGAMGVLAGMAAL